MCNSEVPKCRSSNTKSAAIHGQKNHKQMHLFLIDSRSRILERTILLRFLGIILRVLRLEVTLFSVYITNQFQTTFAHGGGGEGG
jgi:hypothetical protein